jgi:mannose-1-phosphate guanylyltransferase/mannose-6-phosphate isomerase
MGRNTAPALTWPPCRRWTSGGDPVLVVTPADQTVTDEAAFTRAMRRAVAVAAGGGIAILGIVPDRPETGYGYIRAEPAVDDSGPARVQRFVEKPDAATAARYLAEGGYFWNAGMFVLRASVWMAALELQARHRGGLPRRPGRRAAPTPLRAAGQCRIRRRAGRIGRLCGDGALPRQRHRHPHGRAGRRLERPRRLGSRVAGGRQGRQGNASVGDAIVKDSRNILVHATSRLVGVVGLDNVVIVETPDAVLVADREQSQEVKKIVAAARRRAARRARAAPQGAPPLGLVRQHRPGAAPPGQAHPGQARCQP